MSSPRLVSLLFFVLVSVSWAQIPHSQHVAIVTLENHSYEQVVGNPNMPYLNQLISKYAIADQYYATMHNSLSALMWLTAGQTVTTNDDTMEFFNVNNIVRQMQVDGVSWKVYASHLPSVGYLGYNVGTYVKRHNPIAYFTDVQSSLANNIVPSDPYLQNDIANGTLPQYSYITPDLNEDAHDGPLALADAWLSSNIPQLLASPQFQQDGILFVVFDEGSLAPVDPRFGGGRVATLVIGPGVKTGFHSQTFYNHQSLLHTTCIALGLSNCPGGGETGVPMADFFGAAPPSGLHVNLLSPTSSTATAPLHIAASGVSGNLPATGMAAYVENNLVAQTWVPTLVADVPVPPGTHTVTVRVWDSGGNYADVSQVVNVN